MTALFSILLDHSDSQALHHLWYFTSTFDIGMHTNSFCGCVLTHSKHRQTLPTHKSYTPQWAGRQLFLCCWEVKAAGLVQLICRRVFSVLALQPQSASWTNGLAGRGEGEGRQQASAGQCRAVSYLQTTHWVWCRFVIRLTWPGLQILEIVVN